MPVRKLIKSHPTPQMESLKRRLVEEWRSSSSPSGQPIIVEDDTTTGQTVHLYVIWDDWAGLEQVDRSEIIMDAFEEVHGTDQALNVTVAMGLTPVEAERLGIQYQ